MTCSCDLCRELRRLVVEALIQRKSQDPMLLEAYRVLSELHSRYGELSQAPREAAETIREVLMTIKERAEEDLATRAEWALEEYITLQEMVEEIEASQKRPKFDSQLVGRLTDLSPQALDLLPFKPRGNYTVEILEFGDATAVARISTEIGTHQKAVYIFLFLEVRGTSEKPEVVIRRAIVETDIPLEPGIKAEAFKNKIYEKIEVKLLHERFSELSIPPEAVEALVMGNSWYSELADRVVVPALSELIPGFKPLPNRPSILEIEELERKIRPTILGYLSQQVRRLHQKIADLKAQKGRGEAMDEELSKLLEERNILFGMMKIRLHIDDSTTIHIHDHTIQKVTTMPLPHTIDVHIKTWEDNPCVARLLNKAIGQIQKNQLADQTIMELKAVLLPRPKVVPPARIEVERVLERFKAPKSQWVLVWQGGQLRRVERELPGDLGLREVLVRVLSSAVDVDEWRDVKIADGIVPGDKFAGSVVAIGRDVTSVAVGDMVVGVPIVRCGRCPNCLESGACSEPRKLGTDLDGSFAQFVKLPEENVLRIPCGRISLDSRPDAACLAEALAIAEHAITKSTVFTKKGIMDYQLRKPILVLGTNMVALNILQRLLEGYSDRIIVVDEEEERLERLNGLPQMPDFLGRRVYPVLATSANEAVSKVLELAGRRIRMIFNALGTRRSTEIAYRVMDVYAVLVNVAYTTEETAGLHHLIEGKKVTIYDCPVVPYDELKFYMELALISMSYSRLEPWRFKALRVPLAQAPELLRRVRIGDSSLASLSQVTVRPQE